MAIALSEDSPALLTNLQPLWHRSAPRRVLKDCPASDPLSGWRTWQKHIARRKRTRVPLFLLGQDAPLLWGWRAAWDRNEIAEAIQSPERIAELVLASDASAATSTEALQWVALAYALSDLTNTLPAESWWQLIEILHDAAIAAQRNRVDAHSDAHEILRHELMAGELPLALAYLFPEIRSLRALGKSASTALSDSLIELTDGQGMPQARLLPELAALFACWTRCRWIGEHRKRNCWSDDADVQYQWLIRHGLRLADGAGDFMLTEREESNARWPRRLFRMALELAGDRGDRAAASATLSGRVVPRKARFHKKDLPRPAFNSQWSGLAVLGTGWSKSAVRLAVSEVGSRLNIELRNGREQFFAGEVVSETMCDGQLVRPVAEWEQACWHSNKHCDYLELSIELSDGVKLERQFVLGRANRVLYLADIVHAPAGMPHRITHSVSLPLSPGIQWKPEQETCDGLLLGAKRRAAVLPLALSEWRSESRSGRLAADNGQLTLAHEASGSAMCCPFFIDFKSRRAEKDRTWRRLTVAESLATVPHDVAVGYRAQTGRDQWLFYRSLAPPGNRTLLGHNISGEFCAGRFAKGGKFDEWIEIEAVQ